MLSEIRQIKYIIHHASPGLGDNLITLCSAYDYAVQYKVPLIIDWRNSRWLSYKRKAAQSPKDIPNLFEILFDNRNTLGDIKIITDPIQIYEIVPHEELTELKDAPQPLTGEVKKIYTNNHEEILPRNYDHDIQINQKKIALIRSLRFSETYTSKADDFLKKHGKKDIVAIHIRIDSEGSQKVKKRNMPRLIARAVAEVHDIIKSISHITNEKNYLYITSDTPDAINHVKKKFKDFEVINYSGTRHSQGVTAFLLHADMDAPADESVALLETTIVEMLILSKAKYLISINYKKWISGFTYYARNFILASNCYFITGFRSGRFFYHISKNGSIKSIFLTIDLFKKYIGKLITITKNLLYLPKFLILQTTTADKFVSFYDKLNDVIKNGNLYAPIGKCNGIIRSRPFGFFSNFMGVLGLLAWCEQKGKMPTILFDSGAYLDPTFGSNWWEYYFERISPANPSPTTPKQCFKDEYGRLSYFARDRLSLSRKHELVEKHIKIKPHILEKVDRFTKKEFSGHYVVGIHLRGTDKSVECAVRLPIDFIREQIDNIIKAKPNYKIFLATEDQDYLSQMQTLYKGRLVSWDSTRSHEKAVHNCKKYRGYKIGEDVLIDCLLLSKCNYLLASISNVSHCALVFNPGIEHTNIMARYKDRPWSKP